MIPGRKCLLIPKGLGNRARTTDREPGRLDKGSRLAVRWLSAPEREQGTPARPSLTLRVATNPPLIANGILRIRGFFP